MGSEVSILIATGAGILSFFSPCILPLLPPYLSFITGISMEELLGAGKRAKESFSPFKVLYHILLFILGFSAVFMAMGASASAIGQFLFHHVRILQWIGGLMVIFFGLHFTGLLRIPILYREKRLYLQKRPAHLFGAFLVGVAFAVGWTPCIGPILGSILAYAGTKETIIEGMILLGSYSAGLAIPFIATGLAVGLSFKIIKRMKKYIPFISAVSGILLIIMGILIITDNLKFLSLV